MSKKAHKDPDVLTQVQVAKEALAACSCDDQKDMHLVYKAEALLDQLAKRITDRAQAAADVATGPQN